MHQHAHHQDSAAKLKVAFLLNLAFTLIELAGGIWTNSIAIITDALHDGGDCFALGMAWYFQKLSQKRPDAVFTYGYRRFSSLGALVTGVVLIVGLTFVGYSAIGRLQNPQPVKVPGMLAISVLGIVMNGAAAWMLRGGTSLNEKVATWHLLEDTLGWAAVLVGGLVMAVWDVPIIDPLLAILISLVILWNVFGNLKKVVMVFLQSAPPHFDVDAFNQQVTGIAGVVGAHHTHTWTLDGERHVFSTHLVVEAAADRDRIVAVKQRVHELLRAEHFEHITVEIELEGEACAAGLPSCEAGES